MTYGAETVIPIETSFSTLRTSTFTPSNNEELLGKSLDLIEEKRKSDDTTSLLPPETQAKVRCQCEATTINTRRLGIEKSFGKCQEPSLGKAGAQLGRTISHHFSSRDRCILLRRLR